MSAHAPRYHKYDFLHFAARACDAGAWWAGEFKRCSATVGELLDGALRDLRQGRLREGEQALNAYGRAAAKIRLVSRSMQFVFDARYHSVNAYKGYCTSDFERAREELDRSHYAVVEAVSCDSFLLILTTKCVELRLHHARIARNQRRWAELDAHVRCAREMTQGRMPLCALRSGQSVFFSTLSNFLQSVEPLTADEHEAVQDVVDLNRRMAIFGGFVHRLRALPEFGIRY